MYFRVILISLYLLHGNHFLNGQETENTIDKKWSVGIEYRPFNYTLLNYGETTYIPRSQLNSFNFQSVFLGLNFRKGRIQM